MVEMFINMKVPYWGNIYICLGVKAVFLFSNMHTSNTLGPAHQQ